MNDQYKKDEKRLKDIIHTNLKPLSAENKSESIILYKSMKTQDLLLKNNMTTSSDPLSKSWTVYKYSCPRETELPNPFYIGQTRNTIRPRLEQHSHDGTIKEHNERRHKTQITLHELEQKTVSITVLRDFTRIKIYEALLILHEHLNLNRQKDNFINPLKLFSRIRTSVTFEQTQNTANPTHTRYNLRSSK